MKEKKESEEEVNKFLMDFIDWDLRRKGENNFFIDILNKYNCKKVFNSAVGDGYDTVNLVEAGFEVTNNEIDSVFLRQAIKNAASQGIRLENILRHDWREIPDKLKNSYDGLICLGNSITYLMNRKDQLVALKNFNKILKPKGIAVIDSRNYDYMLDERKHILKDPINNFRYSGKYYYGGSVIKGYPVVIEDDKVVLEYLNLKTKEKAYLTLYPFRRKELIELMNEAGLKITETYGDFKINRSEGADFYQFIGRKQ